MLIERGQKERWDPEARSNGMKYLALLQTLGHVAQADAATPLFPHEAVRLLLLLFLLLLLLLLLRFAKLARLAGWLAAGCWLLAAGRLAGLWLAAGWLVGSNRDDPISTIQYARSNNRSLPALLAYTSPQPASHYSVT